jgi:hypothetical protein
MGIPCMNIALTSCKNSGLHDFETSPRLLEFVDSLQLPVDNARVANSIPLA